MKKISRTKQRTEIILMALFVITFFIGYSIKNYYVMGGSFALFIAFFAMALICNRCPYCHEFFRGVYWSKPTAGFCKSCGRPLEYDK